MSAIHVPKLMHNEADLAEGRKKFGAQSASFKPLDVPSNTTLMSESPFEKGKIMNGVAHMPSLKIVSMDHHVKLGRHQYLLVWGQQGGLLSLLCWNGEATKMLMPSRADLICSEPFHCQKNRLDPPVHSHQPLPDTC